MHDRRDAFVGADLLQDGSHVVGAEHEREVPHASILAADGGGALHAPWTRAASRTSRTVTVRGGLTAAHTVGCMSPLLAVLALAALVLLATGLGLLQRSRSGRLRAASGEAVTAEQLGIAAPLGTRATLVQFSTPTCAQCPGTARLLAGIAAEHDGVAHLEVDLTRHPDVADRFAVLQTPTTLLVDADRRIRARIGGAPRRADLGSELETVLGGPRAR